MFRTTLLNAAMHGDTFLPPMLSGWFILSSCAQAWKLRDLSLNSRLVTKLMIALVIFLLTIANKRRYNFRDDGVPKTWHLAIGIWQLARPTP
jgi:hypothetical protein